MPPPPPNPYAVKMSEAGIMKKESKGIFKIVTVGLKWEQLKFDFTLIVLLSGEMAVKSFEQREILCWNDVCTTY
jgi:hypothetical protein